MKKTVRYAIVVSRYNQSITQRLLSGAILTFRKHRIPESAITVVWVPGAFEIPLIADRLARSKRYSAVICLGCVLKGETQHHVYICQTVAAGILEISLKNGIPVTFGVLTPDNMKQALARSGNNSANKGTESAESAIEMVTLMKENDRA
ncbi:MAG: 6,7-dimethyl-8-ribityllumazine synthase [Elusimicrobia bacterium]|nr:6,7-dimethyl-8-ribityllumazine synthase [Elusimicrobiota bacterium]